jgi:hypothetical protein
MLSKATQRASKELTRSDVGITAMAMFITEPKASKLSAADKRVA